MDKEEFFSEDVLAGKLYDRIVIKKIAVVSTAL